MDEKNKNIYNNSNNYESKSNPIDGTPNLEQNQIQPQSSENFNQNFQNPAQNQEQHVVHESGHFESIPVSPEQNQGNFVQTFQPAIAKTPTPNKWKKNIIKSLIIFSSLVFLGIGGFWGYLFYVKSSDSRILNKASKNIINANNLKADFRIGFSGFSVKGNLSVDKDQDMKGKLDNDLLPLEVTYIKRDDSLYMEEISYRQEEKTNSFLEYKNVYKAIEKYGLNEFGIDSINPNKNYFTAANIKFFKRVGIEKIDGKSLYKYTFEPDEKAKQEGISKANEAVKKIGGSNFYGNQSIKEFNTKIEIWIGKNDFMVYKVEGETDGVYEYEMDDTSYCYKNIKAPSYNTDYNDNAWDEYDKKLSDCEKKPQKLTKSEKFSFEWSLNLDYDYKENIELQKDIKIIDSVDLLKIKEEASLSSEKTKIRSDGKTIQVALESYYARNRSYPSSLDVVKNNDYILNYKEIDFNNFDYKGSGENYTLILKYKGEKIDEFKASL